MKIAITGAAGWLGRKVTTALGADHELVLVDHVAPAAATVFDPSSPTGRSLAPLSPDWPYHQVELADPGALVEPLRGVDVVVHLAAWPTGDWDRAHSTMESNVMGTFNVYDVGRTLGLRRVVNASSINAYGSFYWRVHDETPLRNRLPLVEDEPRIPEDPYSLSKGITEDIGATFHRTFAMEAVNLRFAGVWPESRYDEVTRDGLPRSQKWADDLFQWVHPDDVTAGIVLAATVPAVVVEPMVLAGADTCAPEPTLELIRRFRPELERRLREPVTGRASLLSTTRARTWLGYVPQRTLAEAASRSAPSGS